MNPLAILIVQLVARYGPDAVAKIIAICHREDATPADWAQVFADIKALDYDAEIAAARARAQG